MTTGVGRRRMISPSAVSPSMTGISTSSVMTSGRSASIFSRASAPSRAWPTTSHLGVRRQDLRDHLAHEGRVVHDQRTNEIGSASAVSVRPAWHQPAWRPRSASASAGVVTSVRYTSSRMIRRPAPCRRAACRSGCVRCRGCSRPRRTRPAREGGSIALGRQAQHFRDGVHDQAGRQPLHVHDHDRAAPCPSGSGAGRSAGAGRSPARSGPAGSSRPAMKSGRPGHRRDRLRRDDRVDRGDVHAVNSSPRCRATICRSASAALGFSSVCAVMVCVLLSAPPQKRPGGSRAGFSGQTPPWVSRWMRNWVTAASRSWAT